MEFKIVSGENLEIGKLYKILRHLRKRLVIEKGIFIKQDDQLICFKLHSVSRNISNYVYIMDHSSEFYEMIPKRHKIQEAMEARALKIILHNLIPYYTHSN
jgi:hypothetical protein